MNAYETRNVITTKTGIREVKAPSEILLDNHGLI